MVFKIFRRDVDTNSLKVAERTSYSKNKNNVYFATTKIDNADLKTFKSLGSGFANDKNNCYEGIEVVEMSECDEIEKENIFKDI